MLGCSIDLDFSSEILNKFQKISISCNDVLRLSVSEHLFALDQIIDERCCVAIKRFDRCFAIDY